MSTRVQSGLPVPTDLRMVEATDRDPPTSFPIFQKQAQARSHRIADNIRLGTHRSLGFRLTHRQTSFIMGEYDNANSVIHHRYTPLNIRGILQRSPG